MSHHMPENAASDIYRDILAKHNGDHAKAQQVVAELGLPLPRSAPDLSKQPSIQDQSVISQEVAAPAASSHATPNPGFICPLTGIMMRDPVVLEATCISFERIAIMWWLSVNPDTCPVTGRAVADGVLKNDDELRDAILAWAKLSAPHLVDYRGRLIAATFPEGIQQAVQDHRASSMALPDMRTTPHAGFAGTSAALSNSRQFPSNRIHQQHPEYLAKQDSMAMDSPGHSNWGLYQYESRIAHQNQIQDDRNFALALAQAGTSAEMSGGAVLPHKIVLWSRLAQTRSRQHFYMVIPPVLNAVLLCGALHSAVIWFPGFLFALYKNDWGIAPIEENPWLGPTADALRRSGSSCSACLKRGQWWRLLSAVLVPAGIIHLFSTMAFLSVASVIATRTGLGALSFLTSVLIGAIAGSATSGLTAPKTISSATSGLAAAAVATSAVAVLSVRRLVESCVPVLVLLSVMLVLLFIAGLAPLVDSWSIIAGGVAAGLCTSAIMVPYGAKAATKGAERRVVTWQVSAVLILVTAAAVIAATLLVMPRTGYTCKLCNSISCQDFLGWQCREAIDSEGFCEVTVFPDSRAVLTCPDGSEEELESTRDGLSEDEVDQRCEELCRTD